MTVTDDQNKYVIEGITRDMTVKEVYKKFLSAHQNIHGDFLCRTLPCRPTAQNHTWKCWNHDAALLTEVHLPSPELYQLLTANRIRRIVTILEGGRVRIGFLTKCGGINRGDTPRVPKAPRGVPEVDPDTRGQENPIS